MRRVTARLRQAWRAVVLAVYFLYELFVSNLRVAADVITPRMRLHPAVLEVPLRPELGDAAVVLFANLISLTPGTLTLEVDEPRRVLFVHVMYPGDDRNEAIADLDGLQRRLAAALTPEPEVEPLPERPSPAGRSAP